MKTILHISHHIGCFRDQQYILTKLGYKVINLKFYDNQFTVTKDIASVFWSQYKDIINSCDYILISDTSPISRCILQHFNEFKSKLIIWICNRFDYGMFDQIEYYSLFDKYKNNDNVKIVASTFWEKIWCLKHKIDIINCSVINPLGIVDSDLEKFIPQSKIYDEWYNNTSNIFQADVYVPFYRNDNIFFNLTSFLNEHNITVCNTTFSTPNQLKQFKAYVTLPDTFCKWFSFEAIHLKLPVILPSKTLLSKLCKTPNYLYNVTGYGGAELMTDDLISIGEWYNPKFEKCRAYFDSFEDLPNIIKSLNKQSMNSEFENCSFQHEQEILTKWKNVYETF